MPTRDWDVDDAGQVHELVEVSRALVEVNKKIISHYRVLRVAFFVLLVVVIGGGKWTWDTASKANTAADSAATALCTFRDDLRDRAADGARRIKQSEDFVKKHPEGFAGFSVKEIERGLVTQRQTLTNQRRTIESFRTLKCPSPRP